MRASPAPGTLHVGIAGPIASADVAGLLHAPATWPRGYPGAPLLATLIAALLARGHRVSAFTLSSDMSLSTGAPTTMLSGPGFALHCVPMRPRAWPCNGRRVGRIVDLYAFERQALAQAMRRAAPDVVHAHWSYEFAWAALASGLPHVITCHDAPARVARLSSGATRIGYRWLRVLMARHVLARARSVTAVSPYMRQEILPWCRSSVAVVPNPLAEEAFVVPARDERRGTRIVMACNGWSDFKNPRAALRAFDLLGRQGLDCELVACGDDFEAGGVADRWWREQGLLGQIQFRGRLDQAGVRALLRSSAVLVHPSLEESFGMVVAEAMAAGLPVVAGHASGAVPWVLGDSGRLVDVTRPAEIAAALAVALAGGEAVAASARLGRAAARERFAADHVAGLYESQYAASISASA